MDKGEEEDNNSTRKEEEVLEEEHLYKIWKGFPRRRKKENVSNYSLRPTPGAERTPKVGVIPASQEEKGKTESVLGLFQEMAYDELFSFPHDEESTNHLCSISGNFPMPEI